MTTTKTDHVVLLHGLGRSRWSMLVLAWHLRRQGYAVTNFGYPSRHKSIDAQVESLAAILEKKKLSDTPLSFVTHSLGSIVCRRFAVKYRERYKFHRAVMLGPPNQGSNTARQVAKIGFIRSLLGPALIELQEGDVAVATDILEVGVIAGGRNGPAGYSPHLREDNDAIVSVEETRLPGMRDHIVLPGLHSFLMYQPTVLRQISAFLETGAFQR